MSRLSRFGILLFLNLCLLASCSDPFKSAKDAADRSKSIKDYTEKTMEAMKGGAGLEAREDAFDRALEEKNFNLKTDHTAVYFQAMSFQLLGIMEDATIDLEYTRDKQKADSVRDFVKKMSSLMEEKPTVLTQLLRLLKLKKQNKDLTALDSDNNKQTLYAFAATMHEINMTQRNNLGSQSAPYLRVVSFFDVVTNSLKNRPGDLRGNINRSSLSLTDQEVLREADKLITILKLRYMILPIIALGRMSNIQEGLIEKISMLTSTWTIRNDLGTEQINYLNDIFDRARRTKEFLTSIGEKVTLDPKVVKIYKNLNLNNDFNMSAADAGQAKVQALDNLKNRIKNM